MAELTYAEGEYILLRLSNQPTSHPLCNPTYFAIASDVDPQRRQNMLSRLLLAKATKETVTIGYDESGTCDYGYIRVYRVG